MTTVKGNLGQDPQSDDDAQHRAVSARLKKSPRHKRPKRPRAQPNGSGSGPRSSRWRGAVSSTCELAGRNPLFTAALAAAAVPRLVAMLGYQPAILFRMDSFDYLWGSVHPSPNVINPSGYSLFLWLFRPFHSLVLVAALQHVMGMAMAVMIYALLRRYGLPRWGATLATTPVLFDPSQLLLEQMVMADVLASTLMVAALALLLTGRLSPGRTATAGLLMGLSAIVRPTVLPLILLMSLYLLIRRAGWRPVVATLAAGALPVVAYAGWFDAAHGSFNLTNSDGLFLWSRTMSFARCPVINPPRNLRPLCPSAQPGALGTANPVGRPRPSFYLWNRGTWQWQPPVQQFVPDTAAFTEANNVRAQHFAIRAIAAQPVSYAHVVLHETSLPFRALANPWGFPQNTAPDAGYLRQGNMRYAIAGIAGYTGSKGPVSQIERDKYAAFQQRPYVQLLGYYQRVIFLPGPLLGLIILAGLVCLFVPRRRSWGGALLWVSAVVVMVLPTAMHEYTYRYFVPAIPLFALSAALMFRKPEPVAHATKAPPFAALRGTPTPSAGAL